MNWILLLILYLNCEICSNVEDVVEQDSFEEPTDRDSERELEEDRRFIEEMDLFIKEQDEISKKNEENIRQTFKQLDDLYEEIKNRQPSIIKN